MKQKNKMNYMDAQKSNECKRNQLVANVEQYTKAYQSSIIDEMFDDAYYANINLANALKALNDFDNNKNNHEHSI